MSGAEGEPGKYSGAARGFGDMSLPVRRLLACSSAQEGRGQGWKILECAFRIAVVENGYLESRLAQLVPDGMWSNVKLAPRAANERSSLRESSQ